MPKEFRPVVTDGFTQLRTVLPDGKIVSTVKLPEDVKSSDVTMIKMFREFGVSNRPYLSAPYDNFETMVFPSETNFRELDCKRYSTAEKATQGHEEMVRLWTNKK